MKKQREAAMSVLTVMTPFVSLHWCWELCSDLKGQRLEELFLTDCVLISGYLVIVFWMFTKYTWAYSFQIPFFRKERVVLFQSIRLKNQVKGQKLQFLSVSTLSLFVPFLSDWAFDSAQAATTPISWASARSLRPIHNSSTNFP